MSNQLCRGRLQWAVPLISAWGGSPVHNLFMMFFLSLRRCQKQWLEDELPKDQCVEVVRELEWLWMEEEQTRQQSNELWRRIIAATCMRDGGVRDPRWHPHESATESESRSRSRPQKKALAAARGRVRPERPQPQRGAGSGRKNPRCSVGWIIADFCHHGRAGKSAAGLGTGTLGVAR